MTTDKNARIAAIAAGKKRYTMTKPCRRGHLGERYASCGVCVQCNEERQKEWSATTKYNKRVANTQNFTPAEVWKGLVRPEHHAGMQRLADVYGSGDREQIEQVDAFIHMIRSQVRGLV